MKQKKKQKKRKRRRNGRTSSKLGLQFNRTEVNWTERKKECLKREAKRSEKKNMNDDRFKLELIKLQYHHEWKIILLKVC